MMVIWFLVAVTILVAVHEFGHFWVARRVGIRVLRFSIGFGPRLLTWSDKQGTEFAISAAPLGGYVKMLDEREGEVPEEWLEQTFNSKKPWQRIAVALAGPAANFILALALYWLIFMRGTLGVSPVIGEVEPGSIAHTAGLDAGQEIIAVDEVATPTRRDVVLHLLTRLGETGELRFTVKYPDNSLEYHSTADIENWLQGEAEPDPLKGLGLEFYYPPIPPLIDEVLKGSAAEKAGLKAGDYLQSADDIDLADWQQWVDYVRARPGQEINLEIRRDAELLERVLVPDEIEDQDKNKVGKAGVSVVLPQFPEEMLRRQEFGLVGAFSEGIVETWETSIFVLVSLKKLIFGEISVRNLSGPIGIAKVATAHAESGAWSFIAFLAHLSIVLGVLNLLPIPVLDGGHVLYHLVEWFKGTPLSERVQVLGYQAGLVLLVMVMMLAFYNDILRL